MKRPRSLPWFWIALAVLVVLFVGGFGMMVIAVAVTGGSTLGARVGLVELSGVITDEGVRSVIGGSARGAREFIESVETAGRDPNVKAVVIRINSPGGSAAASQEMYQAVRRLRQKKKVICSMGDMAASGGYYVASACDKIYANPATLTGSIGVITELLNYSALIHKYGIDMPTFKSGKFKDVGNPARPILPEEKQFFQSMVMSIYQQFVTDVLNGRSVATNGKLTRAKLLKLADGRVYTGLQAKANGLIDEIGGLRDAVQTAGKLAGIQGEPKVQEIGSGGLFDGVFGTSAKSALVRGVAELGETAGSAFAQGLTQRFKTEATVPAKPQVR